MRSDPQSLSDENLMLRKEVGRLRTKLATIERKCSGGFSPELQRSISVIAGTAQRTSVERLGR